MHQCRWENLLSQRSGRDLVRLQRQHSPSIGAWLSAIPSSALGTEIPPSVFRILLRWWLGLSISSLAAEADGPLSLLQQSGVLHPAPSPREVPHNVLCCSRVRATNEVQIEGRERPADIFLDRWTTADPWPTGGSGRHTGYSRDTGCSWMLLGHWLFLGH